MKSSKLLTILITLFLFVNLNSAQSKKVVTSEKVIFNVAMDCVSCQKKIEKNIAFEKGVKSIVTNLEKQTVEITFDTRKTNIQTIQKGFDKIGYNAIVVNLSTCKCEKCGCENCKSTCKS